MTSDQLPSPSATAPSASVPVWGAPPPRATWGLRQILAAVGVAVAIAGIGGAAIYAATDNGSTSTGPGMADGFGSGGRNGQSGALPGGPDALHGQFVVADARGGFTTMLTQNGQVTAISDTSITARSDDDFTQTYVIPPAVGGANPRFAVNDTVTIRATVAGQIATVTTISNGDMAGMGGPGTLPLKPGN